VAWGGDSWRWKLPDLPADLQAGVWPLSFRLASRSHLACHQICAAFFNQITEASPQLHHGLSPSTTTPGFQNCLEPSHLSTYPVSPWMPLTPRTARACPPLSNMNTLLEAVKFLRVSPFLRPGHMGGILAAGLRCLSVAALPTRFIWAKGQSTFNFTAIVVRRGHSSLCFRNSN